MALALQAVNPETVASKAVEAFRAGRYAEARDGFRAALKYAPQNAGLWAYLGLVEGSLNDIQGAIADLEKARSLSPKDPQILFDLGLLYRRNGNAERAREMYQQGLLLQPGDAGANQNYALLLMEAGQFDRAMAPLQRLRTIEPGSVSVRVSLIECAFKAKREQQANTELRSFLDAPDVSAEDRVKAAQVLVEDHALLAAETVLKDTVRRYEQSAEAHAGLGKLLLDRNEYEAAVRELGRAAQLAPDAAGYSLGLAEALLLWKHYSPALEFLQAVRPKFGTLPDFHYKLGLAYYGLFRYPEAQVEFEALTRERPQADLAWFFLGNTLSAMGKLDGAEVCYRKAIALNQRNASYYSALGQMLRKSEQDRVAEAVDTLRQALKLDPADSQSRMELALCYERLRRLDEAQTLLEQVVQERPHLKEAHVALARVYYKRHRSADGDREKAAVARIDAEERARQDALRLRRAQQ
jgi:tetratricopeptide (TPR) repeat protein